MARRGVLRADVCIVSASLLFLLLSCLLLCVLLGVTIAPVSREEGSLTVLCSIFELEQQRLFAIFCITKTMVSR